MNETSLIKEFGAVAERRKKAYRDIAMDGSSPYIKMQLARNGKPHDPKSVGQYIDSLVMDEAGIPRQLMKKTKGALRDYDFLIAVQKTHLNPEFYHNNDQLRAKQETLAKRTPWIYRGKNGVQVTSLNPNDSNDAHQLNAAFANVYRQSLRNLDRFMEGYRAFNGLLASNQSRHPAQKKAV